MYQTHSWAPRKTHVVVHHRIGLLEIVWDVVEALVEVMLEVQCIEVAVEEHSWVHRCSVAFGAIQLLDCLALASMH